MRNRRLLAIVVIVIVGCRTPSIWLPNVSRAGTYTNIHFDQAADGFVGMEVHVVPVDNAGNYQASIQIANGSPGPFVVAPVVVGFSQERRCQTLEFAVGQPYNLHVSACLYLEQLTAVVTNGSGAIETVILPRTSSFWDRNGA